MKKSIFSISVLLAAIVIFGSSENAHAKILYTQTEYKNLYNEKVAVELELKSLQNQYSNEKANLQKKIQELENQIANLNQKIANLEAQNAKDRELCDKKAAELQGTIDILRQKSSNREQDLIAENKKMQDRYEEELKNLRKELADEKKRRLEELDQLNRTCSDTIAKLKSNIANLENELSSLKKLTQAQKAELERMADQASELEKQLAEEIKLGQIRLKKFHNKLIINIDDRISFDSGSSDLKKEILPALAKITEILVKYPENTIMVEGHTDNIPMRSKRFRDNWQLSTERALSVLDYMLRSNNLNKSRFGAAGYAEFNPIVPNDTPENRSLNRRVDIVLIPRVD